MSAQGKKVEHPLSYSHSMAQTGSKMQHANLRALESASSAALLDSPRSSISSTVGEIEYDVDETDHRSIRTLAEVDHDANEGKVMRLDLSQYKGRNPSFVLDSELQSKDERSSLDASLPTSSSTDTTKKRVNRWKSIKSSLGKSLKRVKRKASTLSLQPSATVTSDANEHGESELLADSLTLSKVVAKFMKRFQDVIDDSQDSEPFIYYTYFRCRLDKALPFRGTLSLCNVGIYFYGTLFKRVTKINIPYAEIIHIQKMNHSVGTTCIRISTLSKQYAFTHFKDVECAYSLVAHLWQNHGRQLSHEAAATTALSTEHGQLGYSRSLQLDGLHSIGENVPSKITLSHPLTDHGTEMSGEQEPLLIWRRASLDSDSVHGLRLRRRRSSLESQISIIRSSSGKDMDGARKGARKGPSDSGSPRSEPAGSSRKQKKPPSASVSTSESSASKSAAREPTLLQKIVQSPLYVFSFLLFLLNYLTGLIFYSENSKLFLGFLYYACYPYVYAVMRILARLKAHMMHPGGKRLWMASLALWLLSLSLLLGCMKWMRFEQEAAALEHAKTWSKVKERAGILEQVQDWEVAHHQQIQRSLQELNYLL